MTNHLFKSAPKALLVLFSIVAASTVNAQDDEGTVIFSIAQGGNFFGDTGMELSDFEELQQPDVIFSGNNTGGGLDGGRRADGSGDFFFANILFNGTGFSGIDQVNGSGNPGHFVNDGQSSSATFFVNSGLVNEDEDDTLPSGAFMQDFSRGDRIDFSVDLTTNANPGGDPTAPTDSTWQLGLRFDGSEVVQTSPTVTFPTAPGTVTNIRGSFFVTGAATSFNPVSILTNPATGDDQIEVDNIVLTLFEDAAVVGDVLIEGEFDGVLDENDFNAIRDNFFNTGDTGSVNGEAIGAEDGVVDIDDFITFRSAFLDAGGTPAQFAAFSAVPEPTAAVTLVCGLVFGFCRRSRVA